MNLQAYHDELNRIDKWKHLRKDLFRNVEPRVEIIATATPNYNLQVDGVTRETLPAFTARMSHESEGSYEDDLLLNQKLIEWGHTTPLEALTFTFQVTGMSKSLQSQWTRHRIGIGWTFRSTRYVDSSSNSFVYPAFEYMENATQVAIALTCYSEEHKRILEVIEGLKGLGVNKQECRRLQPIGFSTGCFVYTNARQLRQWFSLRLDKHAEWEHRRLAILFFLEVYRVAPSVFLDIEGKF